LIFENRLNKLIENIVAAPAIRTNTSVVAAPVTTAAAATALMSATQITSFNAVNNHCVFINPTSDILNRTIFTHAAAGLSITIYAGTVRISVYIF
jgi:hypothetical protein